MLERTRVRMLASVDQLFEGEIVNLPDPLAKRLINQRQAEAVKPQATPSQNKVVGPAENKSAPSKSSKGKK